MAFLSISLTITYETSVSSPTTAQPPRQQRNNTHRPTAPHTAPSSSSQPTDTRFAFLSAPAQALQHLTRARMHAAQREEEANDDAGSLEVLEAAEARRGRVGRAREAALDRESLWVLEREVGKLEMRRRGASKVDGDGGQGSKGSSSGWTSSFEKVEMTPGEEAGDRTPDPSPTQASTVPSGKQQRVEEDPDPFASPSHGRESDFVRSLVESRRRREEGGVWGDGDGEGEPPEGVRAGVAELMRRFEELGARERVGVEGDA